MPRIAQPAGSADAHEPISLLGNLVKAGLLRYLRAHPNATVSEMCDALQLGQSTLQPRLMELEAAGLLITDPPIGSVESRRGTRVEYRVDDEAVTDLYLRLGMAIGEF